MVKNERCVSGSCIVTRPARISAADISNAKTAAEEAGLCLTGIEKHPDGTVKLEFAAPQAFNDDWRAGSPLYDRAS